MRALVGTVIPAATNLAGGDALCLTLGVGVPDALGVLVGLMSLGRCCLCSNHGRATLVRVLKRFIEVA